MKKGVNITKGWDGWAGRATLHGTGATRTQSSVHESHWNEYDSVLAFRRSELAVHALTLHTATIARAEPLAGGQSNVISAPARCDGGRRDAHVVSLSAHHSRGNVAW